MSSIEYLRNFLGSSITRLEHVRANGVKSELSLIIDCNDLDDYNDIDVRQSEKFKKIFDQLINVTGPTLYWFEIISDVKPQQVIEKLVAYKNESSAKATPAIKANIGYDSKTLYVGKVKKAFWGRLVQHLGFYKVEGTQGLQLFYWAKELSLILKLNVIEFDHDMADFMPVFEYEFAKKLRPLAGRHR